MIYLIEGSTNGEQETGSTIMSFVFIFMSESGLYTVSQLL